jgi:ABC-type polysaccharide/polyol phosphate export permease
MFYSGLVTGPMSALRSKGKLAAQTGFPLIGVVLSKIMHVLFDTCVRAAMVAAILIWQQPVQQPLLAVLAMLAAAPLFLGAGLILAVFATAVRDLDRIVPLVLQYTFFLSFAIFPLPLAAGWIALNPFAVCIDNARHLLVFGALSSPVAYACCVGVGALACGKGLHFLSRAEPVIRGHL